MLAAYSEAMKEDNELYLEDLNINRLHKASPRLKKNIKLTQALANTSTFSLDLI